MATDINQMSAITRGAIDQIRGTIDQIRVGAGTSWVSNGTGGTPINMGVGGGGVSVTNTYQNYGAVGAPYDTYAFDSNLTNIRPQMVAPFNDSEQHSIISVKRDAKTICHNLDFTGQLFRGMVPKYVLAGGCFASMFHTEEKPKDYDIFFLDCDEHTTVADRLNANALNFSKVRTKEDLHYFENENITAVVDYEYYGRKYQFIFTKYKTREELIKHFDFLHTCVSYVAHEDKLYITRGAFDAIRGKKLIPNPTAPYPKTWRFDKFLKKGWITDETFSL